MVASGNVYASLCSPGSAYIETATSLMIASRVPSVDTANWLQPADYGSDRYVEQLLGDAEHPFRRW